MFYAMLRSVTFKEGFGRDGLPNAWIIDEAATLADRIALDDTLATARSANVGIVMALQDVTHFGNEEKQTRYLANCKTMITLRDVSEKTGTFLSKRLGSHTVQRVSTSLDTRGRHMPQVSSASVLILGQSEIASTPTEFGTYAATVHRLALGPLCNPPAVTNQPFVVDLQR